MTHGKVTRLMSCMSCDRCSVCRRRGSYSNVVCTTYGTRLLFWPRHYWKERDPGRRRPSTKHGGVARGPQTKYWRLEILSPDGLSTTDDDGQQRQTACTHADERAGMRTVADFLLPLTDGEVRRMATEPSASTTDGQRQTVLYTSRIR